ncbi:MAG TPA: FprA family A-type flavoprotein [Bacteroidales bacterium]|nr:FprA family A-type flavoprotein [Bacteroidales bacterium]
MTRRDEDTISITGDVKWIGIRDYDIRTFDIVMTTDFGTTYNSFFVNARKKAIIEIAKEKFSDTYFRKLESLVNPGDISYIVVDHTEPDHVGSLGKLLRMAPDAIVVGSGNAIRYLEDIVNFPFRALTVKDGDTLDLGDKKLRFIAAPNLHWPDSMYTYLEEDRILFTCDSFGAHYCTEDIFSQFTPEYNAAFKYYFDVILRPFSRFMLKAIEKISPLAIDCICPGHGPVHRGESIRKAVDLSRSLAREYIEVTQNTASKKVLVTYVSAYGYTKEAAGIIASGIREKDGIEAEVVDIENISPADLEGLIIRCRGILIGSPTINQNTLLPVYTLFALVNPIRDRGKLAGAFGSFGWSGEAQKIISENLRQLKLNVFDGNGSFKFSPAAGEKEQALREFGRNFAEKLLEECK